MRFSFLDFEIDTEKHEFRAHGEIRRIEPQVFDLLHYFVENADRLISRDELIGKVWNGRVVSDATIDARINAARKAVDDDGGRQTIIRTVPRRGFRFVASVSRADGGAAVPRDVHEPVQKIRFCRSADGTRIAYGVSGSGKPVVRAGHWLTHLEHDWRSPIWQPFLSEFGQTHTLIRYDQRGNGLSEWNVDDLSLDAFVADFEAVVDAAELDRFAIYATSQGVPVAVAYAARHPDRLTGMVLHGGFVKGRLLRSELERQQGEAYVALMRHGWGAESSQFLQAFASIFVPDGTAEQIRSLVELQRITTSAENAVRLRSAFDSFDVTHLLGKIATRTLIVHARNDGVHPFRQGQEMAASIPNAEFVVLDSRNHVMLSHDPAWPAFFSAVTRFV